MSQHIKVEDGRQIRTIKEGDLVAKYGDPSLKDFKIIEQRDTNEGTFVRASATLTLGPKTFKERTYSITIPYDTPVGVNRPTYIHLQVNTAIFRKAMELEGIKRGELLEDIH